METIIVTDQATTDAQSGATGTANMIVLYDAPKIRDVISAKIITQYDVSGAVSSGTTVSGFNRVTLYPEPRATLGSGTITSGQIAICSGVTASGATVQIATTSAMSLDFGAELQAGMMLVLKVSTRGEIVRV